MSRLFSLGWRNSLTAVAGLLAFGSDVLLVGLILGPTAAAAYAVAFRAYALLQRLATGVNGAIGPAHAHAARHGTLERRFRIYCIGLQVSARDCCSRGVGCRAYSEPLLELWLGDVPSESAAVLVVLCFTLVLQMPGAHAATLLLNSERASELMKVTLSGGSLQCRVEYCADACVGNDRTGPGKPSHCRHCRRDTSTVDRLSMLQQPYPAFLSRGIVPLLPAAAVLGAILVGGRAAVAEGPGILALSL